jgi:glycosyltransferase involved in cell wall biosynthesis
MSEKVSVVICTWNRAGLLDQTLERLHQLRIPEGVQWELVVVNNNCTDHTDDVIARHAGHLPIVHLHEARPGKGHACNLALARAGGDLVAWTDDDVLVDPGWIEGLVSAARAHPEVVGFAGPIEPWFVQEPDPDLAEAFPALSTGFCGLDLGPESRLLTDKEYVWGANMAFRSSGVRGLTYNTAVGPMPNKLMLCDDMAYIDKVRKAGGVMLWVPGMRVRHYVDPARMTLPYLEEYNYGLGESRARIAGPPKGPALFGRTLWVVFKCLAAYLLLTGARIFSSRRRRLFWLSQSRYHSGYLKGYLSVCLSSKGIRDQGSGQRRGPRSLIPPPSSFHPESLIPDP